MCTAVCLRKKDIYFGRTLDINHSYGEQITVTPRKFPLKFTHCKTMNSHYAIIGTAFIHNGYPLYYDGTNEHGLSIAGLKFAGKAFYHEEKAGYENIASFELIPKILGSCKSVTDAKAIFKNINITNENYSPDLKNTPLHWIISDKESSIVAEPLKRGIKIYDNSADVLTNTPEFDVHMENYVRYFKHENDELSPIPGDNSSESRFVRTVYNLKNSICDQTETECVSQFFHILSNVARIRGCNHGKSDKDEITVYSSCCNASKGIYYYKTYLNSQICSVDMTKECLDEKELSSYHMIDTQHIYHQN